MKTAVIGIALLLSAAAQAQNIEATCESQVNGDSRYCLVKMDDCDHVPEVAQNVCQGFRHWAVQPNFPNGDTCYVSQGRLAARILCSN